jgi:hypothetical protein
MKTRSKTAGCGGKEFEVEGTLQEVMGSYFGASNDPNSGSTPAMITRFHWLESEKVGRKIDNVGYCIHEKYLS